MIDASYNMTLFVNGVEQTKTKNSGSLISGDHGIYIGALRSRTDLFEGTIDNVRIYNRTLSGEEIKTQYERREVSSKLKKSIQENKK